MSVVMAGSDRPRAKRLASAYSNSGLSGKRIVN